MGELKYKKILQTLHLMLIVISVLSIKSRLNFDPHFLQKLYHLSQVVTLTSAVKFEDSLLIVTKKCTYERNMHYKTGLVK